MINYFVSAENTAYYHWQLELLIESFKLHNLQNNLLVALAENNNPIYADYSRNISTHKNIFTHQYTPYNRIYGLISAIQQKLISLPIAIIHPDTILVKPIQPSDFDVDFQMDMDFQEPNIDFIKEIKKVKNLNAWINLGDTIIINTTEPLKRILEIAAFFKNEKLAWAITLLEYYGHLSYNGSFIYENILLDNELKFLIHYKHGLPPFFNKHMFSFQPPNVLGMGEPYDILLQHNPSKTTNFLQDVIRSYKKNQPKHIAPDINIPVVKVTRR
jgi:hypothetical protein